MNEGLVQVFLKPPQLAQVKTRLIPEVGAEGAVRIATEMLERTIDELSGNFELELWLSESAGIFPDLPRYLQVGSELGERMHSALSNGLHRENKVILLGTDCPLINSDYVHLAFDGLNTHQVVIGPAEDGGYGLIGVRQEVPSMFENIKWGTDTVLSQTCMLLNDRRVNYALLPLIWDVDRPEDLRRYYTYRDSIAPL